MRAEATRGKIVELYKQQAPVRQSPRTENAIKTHIRKWRAQHGVTLRTKWTPEMETCLTGLRLDGLTTFAIAQRMSEQFQQTFTEPMVRQHKTSSTEPKRKQNWSEWTEDEKAIILSHLNNKSELAATYKQLPRRTEAAVREKIRLMKKKPKLAGAEDKLKSPLPPRKSAEQMEPSLSSAPSSCPEQPVTPILQMSSPSSATPLSHEAPAGCPPLTPRLQPVEPAALASQSTIEKPVEPAVLAPRQSNTEQSTPEQPVGPVALSLLPRQSIPAKPLQPISSVIDLTGAECKEEEERDGVVSVELVAESRAGPRQDSVAEALSRPKDVTKEIQTSFVKCIGTLENTWSDTLIFKVENRRSGKMTVAVAEIIEQGYKRIEQRWPLSSRPVMELNLNVWDTRALIFACSAAFDISALRMAFVKQLGDDQYGPCRTKNCGLMFDMRSEWFRGDMACRHSDYFVKNRVFRMDFNSAYDYRVTLALMNHLDAYNICHAEPKRPSEPEHSSFCGKIVRWLPLAFHTKDTGSRLNVDNNWRMVASQLCLLVINIEDDSLRRGKRIPHRFTVGELRTQKQYFTGMAFREVNTSKNKQLFVMVPQEVYWQEDCYIWWYDLGKDIAQQVSRFRAVDSPVKNKQLWSQLTVRGISDKVDSRSAMMESNGRLMQEFSRLNLEQKQVILRIITQDGVVPIVGPCGCGKTSLIALAAVAYVRMLHTSRTAVIYAETNDAVDENMKRIVEAYGDLGWKTGELLRVGKSDAMAMTYPDFSLTALKMRWEKQWVEDHGENRQGFSSALNQYCHELVKNAKIVFGTSSSLGQQDIRGKNFDLCICDEGGQAPDTGLVMALRDNTKTLALFGDHRQLPPCQTESDPSRRSSFDGYNHRLDKSALEDYFELGRATLLTTQYRCHPRIMKSINAMFYGGTIRTGRTAHDPGLLKGMDIFQSQKVIDDQRIVLVSLPAAEEETLSGSSSVYNRGEASWVVGQLVAIAAHLTATGFSLKEPLSVLVFSPYLAQVNYLRGIVADCADKWKTQLAVSVATGDSCQGKEVDIALVSLVRNNSKDKVGFLTSPNRVLTMLTRERDYLFIVGHVETLSSDFMWRNLFSIIRKYDVLVV